MREVTALLRRDDVRLVTLIGPGGVGKTRLALQVATELAEHYADGVWFVSLSRLSDPRLVIPTIARTLGLREMGSRSIWDQLREHLQTRRLLLVLDNFEQVAAAVAVADLLESSPGLNVLVPAAWRCACAVRRSIPSPRSPYPPSRGPPRPVARRVRGGCPLPPAGAGCASRL